MTRGEAGALGLLGSGALALVAGLPVVGGALVLGGAAWVAVASARPELELFGAVHTRVPRGVALTIDDGPDPATTPALLAALAAAGAHATFFFLADRAARHPELVRAVVAAGHEVGLHGLEHSAFLTWRSPAAGAEWLRKGAATLELAGAPKVRRFRPPFGAVSPRLFAAAHDAGLAVSWASVRTGDGVALPAARLRERLAAVREGDVVLVHDGNPTTVAELPAALAAWTARGPVGSLAELEA